MFHTMAFPSDVLWRARLSPLSLLISRMDKRESTVESQLSQKKVAGTVSPVSFVYLQSALCLCCTLSVCVGASRPVSGKIHWVKKVLSLHVSVWSSISQQQEELWRASFAIDNADHTPFNPAMFEETLTYECHSGHSLDGTPNGEQELHDNVWCCGKWIYGSVSHSRQQRVDHL